MTEASGRGWWWLAAFALLAVQLPGLAKTGSDAAQSDFANYFTPAFVLARGGDVGALYDRDAFERALELTGIGGLGSFVPHPPANALWLLPFATLPPDLAKAAWSFVLVLCIVLTIGAVRRLSPRFETPVAITVVLAPTLAVRNSLAFGQPYPILAGLTVFGVLALERGRDFLGGFLLGLGVPFKPYALGIGFLFVHRERVRALAGFLCGAALPSLILVTIAGGKPLVDFASRVLPWMVRGEIQDPFSPGFGSVMALANRLLRYEPDLNPAPWFQAPLLARFIGAGASAGLLTLGVLLGRRALDRRRPLDGVSISLAFALASSPFTASYHLVLLLLPALAVAARLRSAALGAWVAGYAILGSPLVNTFRSAEGALAPLAFLRLIGICGLALAVSWPYLNRRVLAPALAIAGVLGTAALPWGRTEEAWTRIESARGYSMMRPFFCGNALRWWSPSTDGRRLETRGPGSDCVPSPRPGVVSRFTEGSWNLFLGGSAGSGGETRLTLSDANEVDPVFTPDGCAVVFASDQGRGLGSTALYTLDVSAFIAECGRSARDASPR